MAENDVFLRYIYQSIIIRIKIEFKMICQF